MHDRVFGTRRAAPQPTLDGIVDDAGKLRAIERPDDDVTNRSDAEFTNLPDSPEATGASACGNLQ